MDNNNIDNKSWIIITWIIIRMIYEGRVLKIFYSFRSFPKSPILK